MWLRSKKEFMKKFGKRVKMFRLLTNLTQEQLAEKCDCSAQTISGIETGYSFPSSNILFKLAEILEVSPAEFFKFENVSGKEINSMVQQLSEEFVNLSEEQQKIMIKIMKVL
ncbi:dNA-binding helix-turn-helix protein [Fusobacterium sp. CAG:439]|nr:dNA-binding helix-turn-helix protein [Fusobacterium sp. CAG:439]